MLKVIALAASVVLLTVPTVLAGEGTERCGEKVTWKGVWCIVSLNDAKAHCTLAAKYENRVKHAEVDGDLDAAQMYRNRAAYQAAECKRFLELHAVKYPTK